MKTSSIPSAALGTLPSLLILALQVDVIYMCVSLVASELEHLALCALNSVARSRHLRNAS